MEEERVNLSERETEVLQCVIEGAGNKEIAAALNISENTVKVHLRNIYTKLNVSSRTEATTAALQQGLVKLEGITTQAAGSKLNAFAESDSAVFPTPLTVTSVTEPLPRPPFFPRRMMTISLLLVLLVTVLFFISQAGDRESLPAVRPATVESFAPTAITNDWLASRPLPAPRANMALVGSGLNLYLIGGESTGGVTNTVSILRTADLVWANGAPKPTAVSQITGAELFGEIYIPGGTLADGRPTNLVEVYSPANDSWRVSTPLPKAVSGGLALSDGSFVYLFGGWDGENYLDTAFRFDPAANSWQILPAMPTARAFAAGGVVKGKLYVVGGYDGERPLHECAYFDPASNDISSTETTGAWHSCADTLLPRAGASAAGLLNKLYLFGGGAFAADPITYSESYNPDADQWSVINTPPLEEQPAWTHLGTTYIETNIYVLGGFRGGQLSSETFVYRPLTYQTFIPIAPVESGSP